MKKYLIVLMTALSLLGTANSFAGGWHEGGGWREGGGWHGREMGYRSGYGVAPFIAGALIGGAVVGAANYVSTPTYYQQPIVVNPQPIYAQPQAVIPPVQSQPHGYYCATSQNFYPNVQYCNVPWQITN